MKKLIALAIVCGFAFSFVACGGGAKKEEATQEDTVSAPAPADTTAADTTKTDTTSAQ